MKKRWQAGTVVLLVTSVLLALLVLPAFGAAPAFVALAVLPEAPGVTRPPVAHLAVAPDVPRVIDRAVPATPPRAPPA